MPVIKLAFLDVGQGDTTVITCPDTHEAIVVDCIDSNAVLDYLTKEQITHLRGVIITHLHADHYKQTANLLYNYEQGERCEVLAITEHIPNPQYLNEEKLLTRWRSDRDKHSAVLEQPLAKNKGSLAKLYQWCKENRKRCKLIFTEFECIVAHPTFDLQDLKRRRQLNDTSIVLQVTGTGSTALLAGDLEPCGWQYLNQDDDLKSDVLKFPHHGGAWHEVETDDLLSIVQPSVVVISVGSNNGYDHPHTDVFDALQKRRDLRLLCTQATDKCQTPIQSERDNVIAQFQKQSRNDNSFFLLPREMQCPCAGSVIIELRDTPVIIQPNIAFHESLITDHFKKRKCSIEMLKTGS